MHDWTDSTLDALRLDADPLADTLVAAEETAGRLGPLRHFLGDAASPSEPVAAWVDAHSTPPPGLDPERLRRGQQVFGQFAVQAMIGLLCKGLPEAYAAPKGAAILLAAGRFAKEPRARLMETARFYLAVMEPGALDEAAAPGVREAQKVRLVHGIARRHIRSKPGYDLDLGAPINQEDLLGTLCAFSIQVLDALPMLGVRLTDAEEEDYLYVWQVVGHHLGLDPAFIPDSPADGRALFQRIRERHHGDSPAGKILTAALLSALGELIPGERYDDLPAAIVIHLCGEQVAACIGIEPSRRVKLAGPALRMLGRLTETAARIQVLGPVTERLGRGVFELVYRRGTKGSLPSYVAP